MIHEVWNAIFCPYCNAVIEAQTEDKAQEELLKHQQVVQCIKVYS